MVKKITHEQSRRNLAHRRRRVQDRHRLAGHWGERSEPMLTSQKISYEIGGNVEASQHAVVRMRREDREGVEHILARAGARRRAHGAIPPSVTSAIR